MDLQIFLNLFFYFPFITIFHFYEIYILKYHIEFQHKNTNVLFSIPVNIEYHLDSDFASYLHFLARIKIILDLSYIHIINVFYNFS